MFDDLTVSIATGVISGIITSGILFAIAKLFQTVFVPWLRDLIYNGIHIGGEWHSAKTPFNQNIKLEIVQRASVVRGLAVYVNAVENESKLERLRTFRVEGAISDRFVQLQLRHTDESRIGVISYLLEIVGDGRRMVGSTSYYDLVEDKVSHSEISFTRYSSHEKTSVGLPDG